MELANSAIRRGRVIANHTNVGYSKASNQAIATARGRPCLTHNNDAQLTADAVDRLVAALDSDERIALAGPRIIDEAGGQCPPPRTW